MPAADDKAAAPPTMPLVSFTLRSPAKINLHLRVAGPDSAGFHPLRSWMITTTLYDELTFARSTGSGLTFTCDDAALPTDAGNLVVRAARALVSDAGEALPPISIDLRKRIPSGAGLGGGSGNAAATLVGLNRLLSLNLPRAKLATLAATLGSDVPFFLGEPSAIATGRGEQLVATPAPRSARHAVLILPPYAVSTALAYRQLDLQRPVAAAETLAPFEASRWAELPATELLPRLMNDLEPAAFTLVPALSDLRDMLERQLRRPVRMSGSGSTLFTLFDDLEAATAAAHEITGAMAAAGVRAVAVELGKPSGFSA